MANGRILPVRQTSEFDYAGHSGELRVVLRCGDYIGGEIFATADVIKIA